MPEFLKRRRVEWSCEVTPRDMAANRRSGRMFIVQLTAVALSAAMLYSVSRF